MKKYMYSNKRQNPCRLNVCNVEIFNLELTSVDLFCSKSYYCTSPDNHPYLGPNLYFRKIRCFEYLSFFCGKLLYLFLVFSFSFFRKNMPEFMINLFISSIYRIKFHIFHFT